MHVINILINLISGIKHRTSRGWKSIGFLYIR